MHVSFCPAPEKPSRVTKSVRTPRGETTDTSITTDIPSESLAPDKLDTARSAKSIATITEEVATEISGDHRTRTESDDSVQEDISDKR